MMPSLRSTLLALAALSLVAAPAADASIARSAKTRPVPLIRLKEGATVITPDPAFTSALQGLRATPTVLPPGESTGDGSFAFPIVAGRLAGKKPGAGYVRHFGGLRLSLPDGTHVDLNNLRLNDGKVARVTTQIGSGERIALAKLDVRGAKIGLTKRAFLLEGATLLLTDEAAQALNRQFATTAFAADRAIGSVAIAARIRLEVVGRE